LPAPRGSVRAALRVGLLFIGGAALLLLIHHPLSSALIPDPEMRRRVAVGSGWTWTALMGVVLLVALRRAEASATAHRYAQDALAEQAVRWQILVEQSRDGIVVLDMDGRLVEVNQRYCAMLGYTAEEMRALRLWDCEAIDSQAQALERLRAMDRPSGTYFETRHRRKDGTSLDVEVSTHDLAWGTGKRLLCIVRDASARMQLEAERELTVRLLRLLNRASGLHEMLRDVSIILQEASGCQAVGVRLRQGEDFPYFETVGFPDTGTLTESPLCPRELPKQLALTSQAGPSLFESGSFFTNSASELAAGTAPALAEAGAQPSILSGFESVALIPIRAGATVHGVLQFNDPRKGRFSTERVALLERLADHLANAIAHHSSQERLRASEELYRTLASASPDAITVTDLEGKILFVSPRAVQLFGHAAPEELLGRGVLDWVAADYVDEARRQQKRLVSEGSVRDAQFTLARKDGSTFVADINAAAVNGPDGAPTRFILVTRDLTERLQLEAQLRQAQKMESLGHLSGGIAHDFNNIIGSILGNAELAVQDVGPGHLALESLDEIRKASGRAKSLVEQILTFSQRHASARRVLTLTPVIEESCRLLRSTLPASVELDLAVAEETPSVLADPIQVQQALLNLCTNAWHALEGRRGRIELSLSSVLLDAAGARRLTGARPGLYACLSVRDTGQGIEAATLGRIFDPFFTTKPPGQGTGLGPSVVHGIMLGHQGAIDVASQPGQGTTIRLLFPAAVADAADLSARHPSEAHEGRYCILYLEDEEPLQRPARRLLERRGYRVEAFTRPAEALEAFWANPDQYDLVLTDLNMPGTSGLEVAREVLKLRDDLPVLLHSGYLTDEQRAEMRRSGVRGLLQKPNTSEELVEAVRQLLFFQEQGF
ncbi:MAG: PAS domain S-box protein, partial [Deltaproteobacteria bacterium]|nr:PAS domain S-box protein [Deltaproteobacteria bacterium]